MSTNLGQIQGSRSAARPWTAGTPHRSLRRQTRAPTGWRRLRRRSSFPADGRQQDGDGESRDVDVLWSIATCCSVTCRSPLIGVSGAVIPPGKKKSDLFSQVGWYFWSRGPDLNQRPSGYEPDELPDCSTPHYVAHAQTNNVLFLVRMNSIHI